MKTKSTIIKLLIRCNTLFVVFVKEHLFFLLVFMSVLILFNTIYAQTPPDLKQNGVSELDEAKKEIRHLRQEIDRVRKERDAYRKDIEERQTHLSTELKVLSAQLSKEIQNDFYQSVSRFFWIVGILVIIATAGGFWKLSDLITNRINAKIDEKEKDIQKLRDKVFDVLLDFRMQASAAIEEVAERRKTVAEESVIAISEIRSKALAVQKQVDASGKMTVSVASHEKYPWFGEIPSNVIGIAGSAFEQYGADVFISEKYMGAFSYFFQNALRDKNADKDGDGKVSFLEAIEATRISLKKSAYSQEPVIFGSEQNLSLFSIEKVSKTEKLAGKMLALLIGINTYEMVGTNLQGAVNDILGFQELLKNQSYFLIRDVVIHTLLDTEATLSNIQKELKWLHQNSTPEDIVLFYFSGHISLVPFTTEKQDAETTKILVPHDFRNKEERFIAVPDIVKELDKVNARNKIIIVDG